jgi:hypothetical protein
MRSPSSADDRRPRGDVADNRPTDRGRRTGFHRGGWRGSFSRSRLTVSKCRSRSPSLVNARLSSRPNMQTAANPKSPCLAVPRRDAGPANRRRSAFRSWELGPAPGCNSCVRDRPASSPRCWHLPATAMKRVERAAPTGSRTRLFGNDAGLFPGRASGLSTTARGCLPVTNSEPLNRDPYRHVPEEACNLSPRCPSVATSLDWPASPSLR